MFKRSNHTRAPALAGMAIAGDVATSDYVSADSASQAAGTALDKGNVGIKAATAAFATFNRS